MKKLLNVVSWWTIGYSLGYIILTLLYCLPRLLCEFTTVNVSHITETFTFPLEIFAWGLMVNCASYTGLDRATFATKTSLMDFGQEDVGDTRPLIVVIGLLSVIWIENILLNLFLGHEYEVYSNNGVQTFKGIDLPLDGITSALVTTICVYIAGNSTIKLTKNIDGNKLKENKKEDVGGK